MQPYHLQDPWVFIRKTLENALDMKDEETVRRMSEMIDSATAQIISEHIAGSGMPSMRCGDNV